MTTPSKNPSDKKPLNRSTDPLARDSRGNASREEIRQVLPVVNAPRKPAGRAKKA